MTATITQADVDQLNEEYKHYVQGIRQEWQRRNFMTSRNVYETMSPLEREEVQRRIISWKIHITPLAEAWWNERGFRVIWPDDDREPMKLALLENA